MLTFLAGWAGGAAADMSVNVQRLRSMHHEVWICSGLAASIAAQNLGPAQQRAANTVYQECSIHEAVVSCMQWKQTPIAARGHFD
jgi:hypothetical protein